MKSILAAAAVGFVCLANPVFAYEPVDVAGGGRIQGTVRFLGAAPAPQQLDVNKDAEVCGKTPKHDESLLVSPSNGLGNVIVHIDKIDRGKPAAATTATLDNRECRYIPHVQAMVTGTELHVTNSDPVLHNTHIRLPTSDVFNYGLPKQGQVIKKAMRRPGLMKVGCDAGHTWMSAWIAVFDHPYFAVTDAEGRFSIGDVPPRTYQLVFWHEKLGKRTKQVTVSEGGVTEVELPLE